MAGENKALRYRTDADFVAFCEVAVLDAAHDAVLGSPTSSGQATFALLATTDSKFLKAYRDSLANILIGNPTVQAHAATGSGDVEGDPASEISWAIFQGGAQLMLAEVWGPNAENDKRAIPGTP